MPSPALVMGVAAAVLAGLLWIQTGRLHSCQDGFARYQGGVEALGRAAEVAKAKRELQDLKNKERTDEDIKSGRAAVAASGVRLRDDIARRGVLPEAAPGGGGPERTCFDSAKLDAALRAFVAGAAGIAVDGESAVATLDALKRRAQRGDQ